jgi:hypothetical protein
MKKLIFALIGFCFITSVHSQVDFNAEYGKVLKADQKLQVLAKEFTDKFSNDQTKGLLTGDAMSMTLVEGSVFSEKLKELKSCLKISYTNHRELYLKLYGSISDNNLADFQQRILKYFEINPTNPILCAACQVACAGVWVLCKNNCDSEYCHGICDNNYIACLIGCCIPA